MLELDGDSLLVLFPTTKLPDGPKLTGVPEIVTPGPPAEMVVPPIEKAVGFGVKTCPPTVKGVADAPEDNTVVLLPITRDPDGPKLTGVPEIVTPGPPADNVVPAIEKAVGFGVKTCPPAVSILGAAVVKTPIAEPGTFIAGWPGAKVCPPMT